MKNKITIVTAFLAVMFALTGAASAYDANLMIHPGNVPAPNDIPVYPGETFHLHFKASHISANVINTHVTYQAPIITPLAISGLPVGIPSDIMVTTPSGFTPTTDPFVDEEPHEIVITVKPSAPFDAIYKVSIPTAADNGFDDGAASRNLVVISPNTTLTKTASPTSGIAPLTVTYTITETNTGDVPLDEVVSDPNAGTCSPPLPDTHTFNLGESRTYTCTKTYTVPGTYTNTVTASGHPIVFNPITGANETVTNITVNETASATVTVIPPVTPCPTGECKFKTWGLLGNVANPEKKFEMLFFSPIPNGGPQGRMVVEDNKLGMTIESTQVTSIVTDKNAGTGTATGRAHVTGGSHPGDYDFTVNVVDAAHSKTPRGTFELILTNFPGGYDNKGNLTFGAISIIK